MTYDVRPPFRQAVRLALQDTVSRQNLERTLSALEVRVRRALDAPEAAALRSRVREVRESTIAQLPTLRERLQHRVSARGIRVCSADTPAEAIACFLDFLAEQDPVAVADGGILEEVGAYRALSEEGFTLLDMDMARYFLHLIEDESAHPVVPLAHLSVRDMVTAWTEATGHTIRPSLDALMAALGGRVWGNIRRARSALLPVAFAVAETGTLVILDDENTVAPLLQRVDTLVLVMGIHRVVPTLADLVPLIEAFARGSRGTPTFAQVILLDAPPGGTHQKVHLVLVDNERERLRQEGPQEPLYCLECGACATVCPAFREVGGQVYGTPYMGPIGHILPPLLWPAHHADEAFGTPMCGVANAVCPVGLDLPALIAHARARVRERVGISWRVKAFLDTWRQGVRHPVGRLLARLGTEAVLALPRVEGIASVPSASPPPSGEIPAPAHPWDRLEQLLNRRGWDMEMADNPVAARLSLLAYLQNQGVRHVSGIAPKDVHLEGLLDALRDVGIHWQPAKETRVFEGPYAVLVRGEAVIAQTGTIVVQVTEDVPLEIFHNVALLTVVVEADRVVSAWEEALPLLSSGPATLFLSENARTFALDGSPHLTHLGPQKVYLVVIRANERDTGPLTDHPAAE